MIDTRIRLSRRWWLRPWREVGRLSARLADLVAYMNEVHGDPSDRRKPDEKPKYRMSIHRKPRSKMHA